MSERPEPGWVRYAGRCARCGQTLRLVGWLTDRGVICGRCRNTIEPTWAVANPVGTAQVTNPEEG